MSSVTPIEPAALPLLLAERHRALHTGDTVSRADLAGTANLTDLTDRAHRAAARAGAPVTFDDLARGAGFEPTDHDRYRRLESLPDYVGPNMRLLVIGLNPSPSSAASGVGFARPGNRFWPAAIAAGLVEEDRNPLDALEHHGVGFTDLAKRTTKRAAELEPHELTDGFARVDRLCRWLEPAACVMVGLLGWRTAVDRGAGAGWHATGIGGRPVYVMPSTSGLNAHANLEDLTAHLAAAAAGRGNA